MANTAALGGTSDASLASLSVSESEAVAKNLDIVDQPLSKSLLDARICKS